MDKFLQGGNLPKFTREEIHNLNSSVTIKEMEFLVKNLPTEKPNDFSGKFYQTFKEELALTVHNSSIKQKGENTSRPIPREQHDPDAEVKDITAPPPKKKTINQNLS